MQPKADYQGSKIPFTELRCIGPYIVEKILTNNNYLVRKVGPNKTQVLHWMRMRPFTPRQPSADIKVKPQEYKSDPEVSLHHDDLYAKTWEYNFEQPIFDAEKAKAAPPTLQEIPLQSDYSTEERRNTPGNPHECSPEIFSCTDEVSDVTDTCPHMEPILVCPLNKCVPRNAHVVVPEIQGTHYVAHTWQIKFPEHFYSGYSLATNSLTTQS